jgi:hypothetical protein
MGVSSHFLCVSSTDEAMKSGVFMAENLLDPKTGGSQELLDASFSRAHGRQSGHDFFEKPENAYRLRRFGAAMNGTRMSMSPGTTLNGDAVPVPSRSSCFFDLILSRRL